ncbi:hypothetical protein [Kribbella pittospori]|uniref:hypothetical protein n=1 Tax=Kribbella pittospori TaxID=722689 RepID=UPI001EDCA213|nr:hypothetical protein [Kribbella pittospori]
MQQPADSANWDIPGGPEVGAAGNARTIADRILQLADAGVTTVSIQPCRDEPDLDAFVHFLGKEVKPLLHV